MKNIKNYKLLFLTFFGVAFLYALITLSTPIDQSVITQYQISENELRTIQFFILFPILAIWFFILYGFWEFHGYLSQLKGAKEEGAITDISNALGILVLQIIGLGLLNVFFTFLNAGNQNDPTISFYQNLIYTYASLLLGIVSYYLLYRGGKKLVNKKQLPNFSKTTYFAFIALGVIYLGALAWQKYSGADLGDDTVTGSLNFPVLLFTVVLPYFISWYFALRAVKLFNYYSNNVKGILYRQIFSSLAIGLKIIVIFYVLAQIMSLLNEQLSNLAIGPILIITFLLLIFVGAGFLKVAHSAKLLRKLEEV